MPGFGDGRVSFALAAAGFEFALVIATYQCRGRTRGSHKKRVRDSECGSSAEIIQRSPAVASAAFDRAVDAGLTEDPSATHTRPEWREALKTIAKG